MDNLRRSGGFTFVEVLVTSMIVAFAILASINVLSLVYKGIATLQLRTVGTNICSEQIALLKEVGFDNLPVTDDSCLPYPLSNLTISSCPTNPDLLKVQTITSGGLNYVVYKYVQYMQELNDGTLEPVLQADMGADADRNLKQATIVVNWVDNGMIKSTSMATLISNKQVPIPGATVSGQIVKVNASGTPMPTGAGSNATVYVVGYPQYTSPQNDSSGNYAIGNVMPGSYNLYAQGLGFTTTYYSGNPVIVTSTSQLISNINIICPKVDGATVSGNVYTSFIITPSATPTPQATVPTVGPTPNCGVMVLMATGVMSGKTSTNWTSVGNITQSDNASAQIYGSNDSLLYTNFQPATPVPSAVITSVKFKALTDGSNNFTFQTHFTYDNGSHWAAACCGSPNAWNGTATTNYSNISFPSTQAQQTIDITNLYTNWSWANVNSIGSVIRSKGLGCILIFCSSGTVDSEWLEVTYCLPTPTPQNTPTYTPTPNSTPTATPLPCGIGSVVKADDGISLSTVVTVCGYVITDIDPSTGFTNVSATLSYGGKSYYGIVTNVPVTLNNTTYRDIFLSETTGVPTINGNVYTAGSGSQPIVGAQVYLSDAQAVSPTTTGGGAYTIFPADTGSYVLTCSKPGYKMQGNGVSIPVTAGINAASPMFMFPVGNVSGQVIDQLDGSGVSGITVKILDSGNNLVNSTTTDLNGNYAMNDIAVSTGLKLQVVTTSTIYSYSSPSTGQLALSIVQGTTVTNQNFKVKQNYDSISGQVQIGTSNMLSGMIIAAVPAGSTYRLDTFSLTQATPVYQGETGRSRFNNPYFGLISDRDATFTISVPVGSSYDVYAYYSCVSYPAKNILKYYKKLQNIAPGATGQTITGDLSTWTSY